NAIKNDIAGKTDHRTKTGKELINFYEAGGTTGHTHEKRIEQIEDELYKSLRRQLRSKSLRGKTVDKLVHVLDYVEKMNRIFEDTTRFAVYLSARDRGLSI